mmetsp:Transcript_73667/g.227496  ORF Transcript_73667/g.227496 Transcript_73667/m.227496 type:complete len:210 (+) Transcript_73667:229-858(+)
MPSPRPSSTTCGPPTASTVAWRTGSGCPATSEWTGRTTLASRRSPTRTASTPSCRRRCWKAWMQRTRHGRRCCSAPGGAGRRCGSGCTTPSVTGSVCCLPSRRCWVARAATPWRRSRCRARCCRRRRGCPRLRASPRRQKRVGGSAGWVPSSGGSPRPWWPGTTPSCASIRPSRRGRPSSASTASACARVSRRSPWRRSPLPGAGTAAP